MDSGFRCWVLVCRGLGFGIRVQGFKLRFRVQGLGMGFRV
jgi:hypothetical protein